MEIARASHVGVEDKIHGLQGCCALTTVDTSFIRGLPWEELANWSFKKSKLCLSWQSI